MRNVLLTALVLFLLGLGTTAGCGVPREIQQELEQLRAEKAQWQSEKAELQAKVAALEGQVAELNKQLSQAKGQALRDPTYAEAVAFIKSDNTDKVVPHDHGLACHTVAANARKAGLNCYIVTARLRGGEAYGPVGYLFVGFKTTDRGWVYFCTSSICADQEVKIVIGEKIHKSNPSWPTPIGDDTVTEIIYLP